MDKILFIVLIPIALIVLVWFLLGELSQPKPEQTKIPDPVVIVHPTTDPLPEPVDQLPEPGKEIPEGKGARHLNPI